MSGARGDREQVFALASVTKLLSAYAILVALEEGSVSLEDDVGPVGSTVRHLLTHASGLGLERGDRLMGPPATRRVYSNAGFEILADHVTSASGMEFSNYLFEAVLAPLGMTRSGLEGSAAHGAFSTTSDLAKFASELLAPTLISPETLRDATTVAFAGLPGVLPGFGWMDPCDWGLGFELRDNKRPHWTGSMCSPSTFGHFGQSGTLLWVDPVASVALVLLTDRPFGEWAKAAWPPLADAVLRARSVG